jgi:hypothetical protein
MSPSEKKTMGRLFLHERRAQAWPDVAILGALGDPHIVILPVRDCKKKIDEIQSFCP